MLHVYHDVQPALSAPFVLSLTQPDALATAPPLHSSFSSTGSPSIPCVSSHQHPILTISRLKHSATLNGYRRENVIISRVTSWYPHLEKVCVLCGELQLVLFGILELLRRF